MMIPLLVCTYGARTHVNTIYITPCNLHHFATITKQHSRHPTHSLHLHRVYTTNIVCLAHSYIHSTHLIHINYTLCHHTPIQTPAHSWKHTTHPFYNHKQWCCNIRRKDKVVFFLRAHEVLKLAPRTWHGYGRCYWSEKSDGTIV